MYIIAVPKILFTWDEVKNRINKHKHSVSFELAKHIFDDPKAVSWLDEKFNYHEERWITLGNINNITILTVIHTAGSNKHGQEIIRIISARKATRKEQEFYFKQKINT